MKRTFMLLVATAIMGSAFMAPTSLNIGDTMPMKDLKMKDVSGSMVSLGDAMTGKGLLVMFSCNTCPYVLKNQTRTNEVMAYAKAQGLGTVVVNSNEAYRGNEDSFAEMQVYAKEQSYAWSYVEDKNHQLADAFGATRTPECYLFDSQGKLVYHGAIDDSPADAKAVQRKHLQVAMDELTQGKTVSVNTSRSVGCSIKRLKS